MIVPLTARTPAELVAQAAPVVAARPDLVEWRVDHLLAGGSDLAAVVEAGRALVAALDGLPLLATIRTGAEGGELPMPGEEYLVVYRALLEAGIADLVDVELRHATAARVIAAAHDAGVPVVASNHDFDGTPDREEIERRLLAMAEQGADVLKIAVMPRSPEDVLTLLSATLAVRRRVDQPLITMAMAGTGVVSRARRWRLRLRGDLRHRGSGLRPRPGRGGRAAPDPGAGAPGLSCTHTTARHPRGVPGRGGSAHSHSMVPGGLLVTSSTTRFTSGTSLVIRVEITESTS
ncbi:type I 3-dehydroquinate dehydratase [Cellulomonas denverensis]|uniref:type I 3-dehydroquinate dehydratase n=1 Tax=Cellulomonas denverensis TaxID=264297 RepID=UPI00406BA386